VHLQLVTCGCEELVLLSHHGPGERRGRPKEAERLNQLLLDAEQLSQLGSWELDHHSGELLWSKGTFWIFETNELSFSPSYEGFLAMVHPQDRDLVDQVYRMSLKTREPYQMQHRICLPDGRQKVVQERGTTSYDDAGNPLRSIGTVQDISKLAEAERKLEQAAYEDPLTGLANRQAAQRQLADLLRDPDLWQEAGGLGVFNLDLDQFQAINDTFGFELGDQLLVAVSRTLALSGDSENWSGGDTKTGPPRGASQTGRQRQSRHAISGADGSGDGGADPSGRGGDATALGSRLGPAANRQGTGLLARDGAQVLAAGWLAALREALPQHGSRWPKGVAAAAVSGPPRQCRCGAAGAGH
jgi:hypothetical protein